MNRVDATRSPCHSESVRKKKSSKTILKGEETPSKGTIWAAELRARCNRLSAAERQELQGRAMRLIYGDEAKPAQTRRG